MNVRALRRALWIGCVLGASVLAEGCSDAGAEELRAALEARLAEAAEASSVAPFYEARGYEPAWTGASGPTRAGRSLLDALCDAESHGLPGYDLPAIRDGLQAAYAEPPQTIEARAVAVATLDVRLSEALLQMANDIRNGRANLPRIHRSWHYRVRRHELDPTELLGGFAAAGDVAAELQTLSGDHPHYVELQEALTRYRELAQAGGWPVVPPGDVLEPGDRDPRVTTLAARLAAEGDLAPPRETETFDDELAGALRRFQERHGLEPTGRLDQATLAELNVPIEERVAQLEVNLERQRWLPRSDDAERIVVNIPEYTLHAYRDGAHVLEMRVIVGQPMNQTPIFADEMSHVIFRPYWNVPESIAVEEMLPKISDDPSYLASRGYDVIDAEGHVVETHGADLERGIAESTLRIRQRTGPSNALGLVKFMFPNEFNVYLHDTPTDHLFDETARGFSHGCIRVEDPLRLAEHVLAVNGGWTRERIEQKMHDPAVVSEEVPLERPLPVYIVYLTAWIDDAGRVQFREDVYGHDAAVRRALDAETLTPEDREACEQIRQIVNG